MTDDVTPLFYLPSVKHITALTDDPDMFAWPGHTPVASTLTELTITFLRSGLLDYILSVTRGAQRLHWQWYYQPDFADQFASYLVILNQ
jgi:hypothetical protein